MDPNLGSEPSTGKAWNGRHAGRQASYQRNLVLLSNTTGHIVKHCTSSEDEHETIALMKWEDKLLGRKFTLVTNHKGLEYFETQKTLSDRQV
jgi:hypothetical protein